MNVSLGASTGIMGIIGAVIGYLIFNWYQFEAYKQQRTTMFVQCLFLVFLSLISAPPKVGTLSHIGGLLTGLFLGMCLTEQFNASSTPLRGYEKKVKFAGFGLLSVHIITFLAVFFGK